MVGALLIGFASPTYGALVVCLFVYSLGQHLFMPAASAIGMELAAEGQTGAAGQINVISNVAAIAAARWFLWGFNT